MTKKTTTSIALVAAVARRRVIGLDNRMPWHLPEDLKYFKQLTTGAAVIMGRKTFESIVASLGRPLPGRHNIVITRQRDFHHDGVTVVGSLTDAIGSVRDNERAFVIGGGEIYAQALAHADTLHLTEIDADFAGDAWFPVADPTVWRDVAREGHIAVGAIPPAQSAIAPAVSPAPPLSYAFVTYQRISPGAPAL